MTEAYRPMIIVVDAIKEDNFIDKLKVMKSFQDIIILRKVIIFGTQTKTVKGVNVENYDITYIEKLYNELEKIMCERVIVKGHKGVFDFWNNHSEIMNLNEYSEVEKNNFAKYDSFLKTIKNKELFNKGEVLLEKIKINKVELDELTNKIESVENKNLKSKKYVTSN